MTIHTFDPDPRYVDVTVVGSSNLDLVANVERLPAPGETVLASAYAEHAGGKGLNQAVAARRAGASTAFVTCLGNDAAGDRLHTLLVDEDVSPYVTDVDGPTGRALIAVDDSAENQIIVVPGANAHLGLAVVDHHRPILQNSRIVLAQLEIPLDSVEAAMAIAKAAGARTVLNPAPAVELPRSLVSLCDIVTPNQHEIALLGGAGALLEAGVQAVVLTLGARGIRVITRDSEFEVPPFVVRPVDTTGAGDAACGALVAALAAGHDLAYAARRAAAGGALATTRPGAVPSLPHRRDIDALTG